MSAQVYDLLGALSNFGEEIEFDHEGKPLDQRHDIESKDVTDSKFVVELKTYTSLDKDLDDLCQITEYIDAASEKLDKVLADDADRVNQKVDQNIKKARDISVRLKTRLMDPGGIKDKNQKLNQNEIQGSIRLEIRNNLFNYYARSYFKAHKEFTEFSNVYKSKVHNQAKRQLRVMKQDLTEAQMDELIDTGLNEEFIQSQIQGDETTLDELRKQADAVKQINEGVREILEMFQTMSALVDQQQETIDNICHHVESTKEYTGKAVVEFHQAWVYQLAARRKMCVCAVLAILVLAVVGIGLAAALGAFDKK